MNTPKHTPGPWETYGDDKSDIRPATKAGKNRIIAQCPGYKTERQANARLIAAAPDLLEALQRAVACGIVPTTSVLDGGAASYSEQVRTADAIRAAIAKATGEQQ